MGEKESDVVLRDTSRPEMDVERRSWRRRAGDVVEEDAPHDVEYAGIIPAWRVAGPFASLREQLRRTQAPAIGRSLP
jgi:hypothetical protein